MTITNCPFCDRIRMQQWDQVMSNMCAFEPLNPVTPGHVLVVPFAHVEATQDFMPSFLSTLAGYAVTVARVRKIKEYNLILNVGDAATQSVAHIHIHIVPRKKNDGLMLPWSGPKRKPRVGSATEVFSEEM